jgi:hypothetical protein
MLDPTMSLPVSAPLRLKLEEANMRLKGLELALYGALRTGVLEDGPYAQSLLETLSDCSNRISALCESASN